MHAYIFRAHTYTHTHKYTHVRTYIHTYIHMHTFAQVAWSELIEKCDANNDWKEYRQRHREYILAMRRYKQTHIHTYIHTHTHMHREHILAMRRYK